MYLFKFIGFEQVFRCYDLIDLMKLEVKVEELEWS